MREQRAAATTAGVFFIIGTLAGILSKALTYFPVHNADDPLAYAADHSGRVATGALLVLVMGLSLTLLAVVRFPVLRRVDEVLASWSRYSMVNAAAILSSAAVLATALDVADDSSLAVSSGTAATAQLLYVISGHLWGVGGLFFGLWLIPMGWLVVRSRWLPRRWASC